VLIPLFVLIVESLDLNIFLYTVKNVYKNLVFSIFYASIVSFTAGIWGIFAVYFGNKKEKFLFYLFTLLLFFTPSVVIAVADIYFWSKVNLAVYGSFLLLVFGLLSKYSFLSYKINGVSYDNLEPSSIESAVIAGAKKLRILWKIVFPQIKRWFFLSVMLIFVFCMNDLGISTLLYPAGEETLVVKLYTLSVNNPVSVSATIALINSFTTLFFVLVFLKLSLKEEKLWKT
jgi:iron(III) transport system permease protein